MARYLSNPNAEHSSCGVGFITNKHSIQSYELLELAHQALCKIPHRGGMDSRGVGDGAGVNIDLSVHFYRYLTGDKSLEKGSFGVGNFFFPRDKKCKQKAIELVEQVFNKHDVEVILWRDVPVDNSVLNNASVKAQLAIEQVVFRCPKKMLQSWNNFEHLTNDMLLEIEAEAYGNADYEALYPISISSRTQVYKGRLNSWEVVPYFQDLMNPEHHICNLFFHTRFSTNTAPNPWFAQPFRRMAHNGELNTDRKNRLSEDAIARQAGKRIIFPKGQSDSSRLDQTLARRIAEDKLDIDSALLAMMPPAWENDARFSPEVRDMLDYLSLSEEKNDGPAALVFSDGIKIGARLDRLGLRPLRSVQTKDYLAVMSEAGQIDFPPEIVTRRGRIEAGGMIVFDHATQELSYTHDILERMAKDKDFAALLQRARIKAENLPIKSLSDCPLTDDLDSQRLPIASRYVGYSLNQESLKFMLDPMLQNGAEKISAMGYGVAPNGIQSEEGGMSRYFTQRFAQVTNPPLDSIREADGMTLRVSLGAKPIFSHGKRQLTLDSPILTPQLLASIVQAGNEGLLSVVKINTLFKIGKTAKSSENNLRTALANVCDQVEVLTKGGADIIILDDSGLSQTQAALPAILTISAANQRLIKSGLRFSTSLVYKTGQICGTHEVALILGFGASAVCPSSVYARALEENSSCEGIEKSLKNFQKAVEKALMKTMGKFGLCTAESYMGGEFFEVSFLDTNDPELHAIFPNMHSPVGGAQFKDIAYNAHIWHHKMLQMTDAKQIPLLGLFKERGDGPGHSYGVESVRSFEGLTSEAYSFANDDEQERLEFLPEDPSYLTSSYQVRTKKELNEHQITPAYRDFIANMSQERAKRPATLRDVLNLPINLLDASKKSDFTELFTTPIDVNASLAVQGLNISQQQTQWTLSLNNGKNQLLADALKEYFTKDIKNLNTTAKGVVFTAFNQAEKWCKKLLAAPAPIELSAVQPASEITACLASGAMSHGALVGKAHEAVAIGTNMAGAMSNSGEGGEASIRYNSVKASKIKQFASGRFGVWAGYLADPCLEEIEIKMAQGAKPGEGGQLPSAKVTVEIAAARGGTPGVELVSPPPHHDTYSIEDLGQLIHDAKAARVRVIVKLVSSEGIGTIAVGVAKAGADVINVAGCTGGTGAAQVTSLKNSGRISEIGITEVHQALCANGIRQKVILRCSNAHQTGLDVIKSAMMGGDSFEFGTTALMMLKCVMAKNCNVKCPVGLTTNPEVYEGDPRALAQYFMNLAQEVRELLAALGFRSLREIRGRSDLLHLIEHKNISGRLDMSAMLQVVPEVKVKQPIYLEANFAPDDALLEQFKAGFKEMGKHTDKPQMVLDAGQLNNCNKSVGAQFSIDIERFLNYQLSNKQADAHPAVISLENGRRIFDADSLLVHSHNSAGQSYGAFNTSGVTLIHSGTCNDGVGKGASGGKIIVQNPGGGCSQADGNVLIGNFALFGATGGQLFVAGQAGDRFGVRNSGAIAVVEGLGDFGCEYMTYGCVVNLGSYGKGFGNGMSGGVAFQYDPSHQLTTRCSTDSVAPFRLNVNDALAKAQEQALLWQLKQHVKATESPLANALLADWENVRNDFYCVIPKALYAYHVAENIANAMSQKQMLEELSNSLGEQYLQQIRRYYDKKIPLFNGQVPAYGERDSKLICQYIIATGIMQRVMEQARKLDGQASIETLNKLSYKLVMAVDKKVTEQLAKDVKTVLADLSAEQLAVLLADKRVNDYKQALSRREVADSQTLAISAWIMERDYCNHQLLAPFTAIEQTMAAHYGKLLATAMQSAA